MSKKSIGTGITRLLFGLKGKQMKVIPYNEMSPQQFEELDRFLGKLGFILSSDKYTLTKQQSDYVLNQIKQLDLYRERIIPGKNPDFKDFIPRENLGIPSADKAKEFKGFKPKVIEGGKDKTRPGKIDYDKMSEFLGVKLRGDETFDELLEIEKRMKDKDPEGFAGGGVPGLIAKIRAKFGKKAITTADKIDLPAKSKLRNQFKAFEERNRKLTEDELDELYEEFDEAVPYPMETVADRDKFLKSVQDEKDYMFQEYKAGRLDPKPGEPNRKRFLQKKMEEMEGSGDKRLMTQDEIEELADFEFRERTMNAEGGIATMFRPKREKFIFGGGVGLKGYLKMLAEGRKTRKGKPMKGSDVLGQGNPKSQVPPAARPFISDRDKSEMKRLRIAQLENVLEGLKEDRKFLSSYEKMAAVFPEVNKLSYNMMDDFLGPKHKERFKGLTTEMLDKEILQVENVLKNLKVGKDKRALNADGGLATMFRPKLKDGGPPNPGRRTFMKLMAGLASIPIVGKIFKPAKIASKVVPLKNTTTVMPDWFPSFVDKIVTKNVGNKIDADLMVFKDKDLPGIKVYKHDDGRVFVEGQNDYYKSYEIDYTPPGYELVDESTGKAVKTKGDFMAQEEVPVNVDPDGNADFDGEVLESVDDILSSDARAMEEYATGKTVKEMKRGEYNVGQAEARAEQAADEAAELSDEFAKGGLATMFRKK